MNCRDAASTGPARGYLTPPDLAELLNVPDATLRNWRYRGEGPPFYRLGRQVRYDRADVDAWLVSCRVD